MGKAESNKESIWLRLFSYGNFVHSVDAMYAPKRMQTTEYGSRSNPTLDWVELFEGVPLNNEGHFNAFDDDGNY